MLVLNYLVIEGYKEAAEELIKEAGLEENTFSDNASANKATKSLGSIDCRLQVRQAIQNGQIDEAISHLNSLNPDILDTTPAVYFHLKLQACLELIRALRLDTPQLDEITMTQRILEIIEFARENLAPIAQEHVSAASDAKDPASSSSSKVYFLEELEAVMGLLAADLGASWPADDLLQPEQRLKTAKEVNSAILASMDQPKAAKLPEIFGLLQWAQERLSDRVLFPHLVDPVEGKFEIVNDK